MHLRESLLRGSHADYQPRPSDSVELPKFSFEDETSRPLVSTERLFEIWVNEDTVYNPGYRAMGDPLHAEPEIIVRA